MSERIRQAMAAGDLALAATYEAEAAERDGYDVTAELVRALAAENADLRARLAALEAVMLELIAERDRAVAELERLSQMSLIGEGA